MSNLVALNDIPTLAILYKLRRLTAPSTTPRASASQPYNAKIALIRSDLTTLKVDAIVNAANTSLMGGGGVDGAIHRAAGPALVKECETLHGCETGSAKITGAYNLPCKNVIHAVGPVYSTTKQKGTHASLLRGCYRRSLELAVENNLQSIAFAALSTGIYGYPSDEAAETAISEVRTFLDSGKGDSLDRIVFCNFMPKDMAAYHDWLPWFFPPTEADLGPEGSDLSSLESSKPLQKQLPDPPKSEPGFEEAPDAKKQKREHYPAADSEDNIENEGKNESGDIACQ